MDIKDFKKIKPSAPMLASIALRYARSPKRIVKAARFLNLKADIPGLNEAEEQAFFEGTLGLSLDAAANALEGKPVLALDSLRDTTEGAVLFLRDKGLDAMSDAYDIPFVSQAMQKWAVGELKDAINDRVLPWIKTTSRLQ